MSLLAIAGGRVAAMYITAAVALSGGETWWTTDENGSAHTPTPHGITSGCGYSVLLAGKGDVLVDTGPYPSFPARAVGEFVVMQTFLSGGSSSNCA